MHPPTEGLAHRQSSDEKKHEFVAHSPTYSSGDKLKHTNSTVHSCTKGVPADEFTETRMDMHAGRYTLRKAFMHNQKNKR